MFNHIMIGTNDIEKSKAFYEKVLKVIGVQGAVDNTLDSGIKRAFFIHDGNVLALSQPIDGEAATRANGMTIGFKCNCPNRSRNCTTRRSRRAAPASKTCRACAKARWGRCTVLFPRSRWPQDLRPASGKLSTLGDRRHVPPSPGTIRCLSGQFEYRKLARALAPSRAIGRSLAKYQSRSIRAAFSRARSRKSAMVTWWIF